MVRRNPKTRVESMVKLNEGHWDRACRLALGVTFGTIVLTGIGGAALAVLGTVVAVVLFATAAAGFCPLYELLGIDTRSEPVPERVRDEGKG